jgi:hypothetical protein
MGTQTGPGRFEAARHMIDEEYDALRAGFGRIVDRVMQEPDGSPSPVAKLSERAIEVIKAHPFIATAVGLGMGYLLVRVLRS